MSRGLGGALVLLGALVGTGCVILRPKAVEPTGGKLVIGQTFEAKGVWACDGGEELTLTSVDGKLALHVATIDILIDNHWEDGRGHHFGMDYHQVSMGFDYVVPRTADQDAFVDLFRRLGGHTPVNPTATYPDGTPLPRMRKYEGFNDAKQPIGDPWTRDMCWAKDGPLAKAAKEKGVKPRDLLLFGAHYDDAPHPQNAEHLILDRCLGETDYFVAPPYETDVWLVHSEGGDRLYLRGDGHGIVVEEAKPDDKGCLISYADGNCPMAAKAQAAKASFYYWERVSTGFEVFWQKEKKSGLFHVYSPGDTRPSPPPPAKTAIAGPLSTDPKAHAIECLLRGG